MLMSTPAERASLAASEPLAANPELPRERTGQLMKKTLTLDDHRYHSITHGFTKLLLLSDTTSGHQKK